MPEITVEVTPEGRDRARLPDCFTPGATLLQWLHQRGELEEIRQRLLVQRQGGYCAVDVIAFLIMFFSAGEGSMRGCAEHMRTWRRHIAGPIGLRSLPHQSSVSRFCSAIGDGALRSQWQRLLFDACDGYNVLKHPSTGHYDAEGVRWDVFDFDPSTLAIRQRGLPSDDETPEAQRRAMETAPGYPGRHRGETMLSRMLLRHSGSGLWLNVEVHPGNGDIRGSFERSIQTTASICRQSTPSQLRGIVRCDGAHGHVPYIAACQEAGLDIVTRISHYGLFEREDIAHHLANAVWTSVSDSTSGPRRQAAELGEVTLAPDKKTRRKDGQPYEPVTARVIATRAHTDNGNGAGVVIDGMLHELFATTLSPSSWPTEDVASLYLGRSDIENAIEQAHELCNLGRIYSFHLPGQEFITAIGLMVYNLQTTIGTQIAGLPKVVPEPPPRTSKNSPTNSNHAETSNDAAASAELRKAEVKLGKLMDTLDWDTITVSLQPAWQRPQGWPYLCCPRGHLLKPNRPGRHASNKNPRLYFQIPHAKCNACPASDECEVGSASNRRISTTVSSEFAEYADAAVIELRTAQESVPQKTIETKPRQAHSEPQQKNRQGKGFASLWTPLDPPEQSPMFDMQVPLFLPAQARKVAQIALSHLDLFVTCNIPTPPNKPRLVAASKKEKSKRRKSWSERLRYNDLPNEAQVNLRVAVDADNDWAMALYQSGGPAQLEQAA
jgi:hypothetical protein